MAVTKQRQTFDRQVSLSNDLSQDKGNLVNQDEKNKIRREKEEKEMFEDECFITR